MHICHCISVRDNVLAVEYPLIESKLSQIDQQMERALSELNWTSIGMELYMYSIDKARGLKNQSIMLLSLTFPISAVYFVESSCQCL